MKQIYDLEQDKNILFILLQKKLLAMINHSIISKPMWMEIIGVYFKLAVSEEHTSTKLNQEVIESV